MSLITWLIPESPEGPRRTTQFWYTSVLSPDTTSSTVTAIFSLRLTLLLGLGPEALHGTYHPEEPYLVPRPENPTNTKDVNLHLPYEHRRG